MSYLSRSQFISTMQDAMKELKWDLAQQQTMHFHISHCSEDQLRSYQEHALENDRFVDFKEMQQIITERMPAAEAHYRLVHDVKPVDNAAFVDLSPNSAQTLASQLSGLVESGKLSASDAQSIFIMAHSVGQQGYDTSLAQPAQVAAVADRLQNDPLRASFKQQLVLDPKRNMVMASESAQDIAMRTLFGANNYAGMTNINCMPIVKLHGELAELGGEIQGSNRDLKDDQALHQRYGIRTYDFQQALGHSDPIAASRNSPDSSPSPKVSTHIQNGPRPKPQ